MRAALLLAVAVAALSPVPLRAQTEAGAAPAEAVQSLPAISVATVEKRVLHDRVIVSGLLEPVERVQVQPLIEGQPVETLEADVGDVVQAGQVLATLSTATLELQRSQLLAQLASAEAAVAQSESTVTEVQALAEEAERVYQRTEALRAKGSASQAQTDQVRAQATSARARVNFAHRALEASKAQVELARAQLANIELQLSRTSVKAPVSGEIMERNAMVGAIASSGGSGGPMFVLVRDSAIEMIADVAESDLYRMAVGQKVTLRLIGRPDPVQGEVRLVEPRIDAATRLGKARISIDPTARLVTGMFADAEVLVVERDTVAVPLTAVGSGTEGATVMRVKDGMVSRVPVKTGIRDGAWIEVVEGLAPGDTVVAKAGAFVRDGDRINPVPVATN
jgi:HlyD family secretion protein